MVVLDILIGLIGLGIVIIVHELGHFAVAKLSGIDVEVFSVGWGRKLFSFAFRGTEYRLSLIPVGGYCKMKGEDLLRRAIENNETHIVHEKGSLFSVTPWKRLLTYFAGPAANFVFSIVVLTIVWLVGFTFQTYDSRIALISDYPDMARMKSYPANEAGLQSGDRIISVGGKPVSNFQDLENDIAPNPGKSVVLVVQRGDTVVSVEVTPRLDTSTGAGVIGVSQWVDPVIDSVAKGSSAARAGLAKGDRIVKAGGRAIRNSLDFLTLVESDAAKPSGLLEGALPITYLRDGVEHETTMRLDRAAGSEDGGVAFPMLTVHSERVGLAAAIGKGVGETANTLALTVKGIGLLFRGVSFVGAVSGPIHITYYVGEIAQAGFKFGVGEGLANLFRFLCVLSVALFFMNLLPIPAMDGGLILLALIELVTGRATRPQIFYRYQVVGFALMFGLIILTTFSDVSFLINK